MRFREPCPVLAAISDSMCGRVSSAGRAIPAGRADESSVASDNRWISQCSTEKAPVSPAIPLLRQRAILPISIRQSYADTSAELQAQTLFELLIFQNGLCNGRF